MADQIKVGDRWYDADAWSKNKFGILASEGQKFAKDRDWYRAYYMAYLRDMLRAGAKEDSLMGLEDFAGRLDPDKFDTSYASFIEAEKNDLLANMAEEQAKKEREVAPKYSFKESDLPGWAEITADINRRALNAPVFDPKLVQQWQGTLNEAYQPYEQEALTQLRNEFNAANPYAYGSGNQMRASSDLIQRQAANKLQQALGMAQTDYDRKWQDYQNALTQKFDLGKLREAASQFKSAQDAQNYWTGIQNAWNQKQFYEGRANELADRNYMEKWAKMMEQNYKTNPWEQALYQLLPQAGQMAGYALGGPMGGMIGGSLGSATKTGLSGGKY